MAGTHYGTTGITTRLSTSTATSKEKQIVNPDATQVHYLSDGDYTYRQNGEQPTDTPQFLNSSEALPNVDVTVQ